MTASSNLVRRLPHGVKSAGGMEKGLLRKAFESVLPPEAAWRRKSGFAVGKSPHYLEAMFEYARNNVIGGDSPVADLLDADYLKAFIGEGVWADGAYSGHPTLPPLVMLDRWDPSLPGFVQGELMTTDITGRSYFRPAADFKLGIRGGPVLPADILNSPALDSPLTAEPGRYALVYSPVTPSGQKVALAAALYGLLDVVSVLTVDGDRLEAGANGYGWSAELTGSELRALRAGTMVRTPTLVDVASAEVLSNDPYRLPYELRSLARSRPSTEGRLLSLIGDTAAEHHWDQRIFLELHVAAYRAGFVTEPQRYEESVASVHAFLTQLDAHLATRTYLLGDELVPSDMWLFSLLVRFDQVYGPGFRLHRYRVRDFPHVWRYLRELYQIPACSVTTDFAAISGGYYLGIPALNRGIVPIGPDDLFLR
jgi:putative glutathione S-transferase